MRSSIVSCVVKFEGIDLHIASFCCQMEFEFVLTKKVREMYKNKTWRGTAARIYIEIRNGNEVLMNQKINLKYFEKKLKEKEYLRSRNVRIGWTWRILHPSSIQRKRENNVLNTHKVVHKEIRSCGNAVMLSLVVWFYIGFIDFVRKIKTWLCRYAIHFIHCNYF